MPPLNDRDLIERTREGDRDAWAVLVRRHAPRLAAYLGARLRRPLVVEKLVEDTIVLAFRHLDELEEQEGFPAWFRRVGAHLALRWYREHRDEPLAETFPLERASDEAVRTRMAELETAMGRLTDAQRMALEQRYRGGLEGEHLAEVLHVDVAKAERLVNEALAALERTRSKASTT
jgi:RNA polymerase sigma-70 factor, ECF subfamily